MIASACDGYRKAGRLNDEAVCRGVQARVLLAAKRPSEAIAGLDEARRVGAAGSDLHAARVFGIDDAYVRGMVGREPERDAAALRLASWIEGARKVHCVYDELAARLSRTLVELAGGKKPTETLTQVAADATAHGFLQIAADARAKRR